MSIIDDICATLHAQSDGADEKLLEVMIIKFIQSHVYMIYNLNPWSNLHYLDRNNRLVHVKINFGVVLFCQSFIVHTYSDIVELILYAACLFYFVENRSNTITRWTRPLYWVQCRIYYSPLRWKGKKCLGTYCKE